MPERFAQAALGHNSKAIHRAYAKKAVIIAPSLEDYENEGSAACSQWLRLETKKRRLSLRRLNRFCCFGDLRRPQAPRQRRCLWTPSSARAGRIADAPFP